MDKNTKNIISLLIIGLVGYNFLKGKSIFSKKSSDEESDSGSSTGGNANPVFSEAIKLAQKDKNFKNMVKNFQNHANRINNIISQGKYPTITIDGLFATKTDRAAKTAFPNTYKTPKSLSDLIGQMVSIEKVLYRNNYKYKDLYGAKKI